MQRFERAGEGTGLHTMGAFCLISISEHPVARKQLCSGCFPSCVVSLPSSGGTASA